MAVVSEAVAVVSWAVADLGEVIGAVAVLCAVPGTFLLGQFGCCFRVFPFGFARGRHVIRV